MFAKGRSKKITYERKSSGTRTYKYSFPQKKVINNEN
jgi:hypothetical protein